MFNKISRILYKGGRINRDLQAVNRSIKEGSPKPIIKRLINKWIGRHIVSRIWFR